MFRQLFNRERIVTVNAPAPAPTPAHAPGAGVARPARNTGGTTTVQREGVFVTPQSLASFAGATGVVSVLWKGLGAIRPEWGSAPLVALAISFLVGLAIYLINETDPAAPPATTRQRAISIFIAVVNSFVLFSAAVGATQLAAPAIPPVAAEPVVPRHD